ncbi:hypothetical protein QQF32_23175 [Lelliottia sp. V106_12]|uniref:Uncharacterized protein n=1 Tax=Lelliottia wanjuensis TaxID=3050585 RepID=A0AAP4LD56_9ENTR|nr:hypothetical protein [Lelliottia sp. V106_12]
MTRFTLWLIAGFGGNFREKRTFASTSWSDADAGFRGEKFRAKRKIALL